MLLGLPPAGADDAVAEEIASRMSPDDFDWGKPDERRDGWRVRGDVRRGTATWAMYERYRDRLAAGTGADPGVRIWLRALSDPRRFISAHMMLCLLTGSWREATVFDGVPSAFVPCDPATGRLDLARRPDLRSQWLDRMRAPVRSIPYA